MLSLHNNVLLHILVQNLNDLQSRTKHIMLARCKTDDELRAATRKLDMELSRILQLVRAVITKITDTDIDLVGFELHKAPAMSIPGVFDFITSLHHAVPELKTDKEIIKHWDSLSETIKKTLVLNYVITASKDISFSITLPAPQSAYEAVVA